MTFGWSQTSSYVDESVALEMLKVFVDFNSDAPVHFIDTARIYAGGKTEEILGQVLKKYGSPKKGVLSIGTKAHPSQTDGLSPAGIESQINSSLNAMQLSSIGEFYLHQPDTEHSLLSSLQKAHSLVTDGLCSSVGMSNYHASEVQRAFELCAEHNLTKPSVYQGLYNPLNRCVEKDLIPLLKRNKCSFVAYNPLAAGLLAGKHRKEGNVAKGRFKDNPNYLPRFYTDKNFEAVQLINEACEKEGISMVEGTYRWLLCHSMLDEHDGILLGASSLAQLQENLEACKASEKGPLSPDLLGAFEGAFALTEEGAFPYWRSYSLDMPNRDALDHGASYSATKK
ncbi:Aldo/keto reductase-like protein [Fragilaria crotonensis]|nr:Aldo/keto reductase-like protein [Fragilaria crotonensis]